MKSTDLLVWKVKVTQSCPTLCNTMDYTVHRILQNNGVGSLSLLQQIVPTQELNRDLLHCWRILYQLRQGRPKRCIDSYFYLLTLLSHCIFNFKDCLILWGAISHKWNEIIWKSWKSYENTHVFFGIFLKWIILVFSITNGRSFQANSFNIGSSDHA